MLGETLMAYFNTGDLDTLVTIQQCVITEDSEGGKAYAFTDFRDVYANVDRSMSEQVSIGNLEDGDYITLVIYKIPELTTRWRVKIGTQAYEITRIDLGDRLSPFCVLGIKAVD